jgi:hypothetical protein
VQETKVIYVFSNKLLVGSSETTREAPCFFHIFEKKNKDEDIVRLGRKLLLHWSLRTNFVGLKIYIVFNQWKIP